MMAVVIPAGPSNWHGAVAVIGVIGYGCIALAALFFLVRELWR